MSLEIRKPISPCVGGATYFDFHLRCILHFTLRTAPGPQDQGELKIE